jgi:AraC-like DNA-binding protein
MAAGVLQGLLLSVVLLKKTPRNEKANRWLSAFIITFALLSLSDVLDRTVELYRMGYIHFLFDWCILLLGPLLLTYVMEMTGERYSFKKGWFLHFLPAVVLLLLCVPFYFMPAEEKAKIILNDMKGRQNGSWDLISVIIVVQIAVYFVWVFAILLKYSRCLREHYSDLKYRNLRWLRILVGVSCGLFIVFIFSVFLADNLVGILNDIGFPIAAYIFGYFGFAQIDLSAVRKEINTPDPNSPLPSDKDNAKLNSADNQQIDRYIRSGLKSDKAATLKQELDRFMLSEKPYLDNDLNLRELAERLEVFPHHLSQLLNEQYGQNFFDFINSYRSQEVKNMLSDPNQKDESILSIAFTCGFNSKATFNAFFKKQTGQTPRQFRADCESKKG